MKPSEIQVGKTYVNRGAGRTRRTVIAFLDNELGPEWYGSGEPPDGPVVQFEQDGKQRSLYLSSFAAWAGREV
jgi:hypothetical protein